MSDSDRLRDGTGAQRAFAELVTHRIDFVYSPALRPLAGDFSERDRHVVRHCCCRRGPPVRMKFSPDFGLFDDSAGKDSVDQIKWGFDHGFHAWENTEHHVSFVFIPNLLHA